MAGEKDSDALPSERWTARDTIACAVGCVVTLLLAGFGQIEIDQPISLFTDHIFLVATIKNFINGGGFRFNDSLGFPGVHDGIYFPSFDFSYNCIAWLFAKLTSNFLYVQALFYATCISAMFLCCYVSLRLFSIRAWVAFIGSVAFVITPYFAMRSFAHDYLSLYFSVPLGSAVAIMLWQSPQQTPVRVFFKRKFVLSAVLLVGTSGLYYAFFSSMFIMLSGAATSIRSPIPGLFA